MLMRSGIRMAQGRWIVACAVCLWLAVPAAAFAAEKASAKGAAKGPKVTYEDHVQPIFREKCFACHNTDKKTAGLDLTNYSAMMAGGGSGAVIKPGSSGDSYLFNLLRPQVRAVHAPQGRKLPDNELARPRQVDRRRRPRKQGQQGGRQQKAQDGLRPQRGAGRPEGPPPMPERLSIEPLVRTTRATAPRTVAVNPWSPLAAVPGQKQVLLYNTKTLELIGVLPFPEGMPEVLKFSRNGLLLLAGGGHGAASGRVVVWNVKTGERIFEVGDELDTVLGADISADQSLIALGGPSKMVRVYSTADGSLKYQMKKHTDWIDSVEFSPDGVLLATGDRNGGVVVWEAADRPRVFGPGRPPERGHRPFLADRLEFPRLRKRRRHDQALGNGERQPGQDVGAHGGGVTSLAFTRDGQLVSCGRDGVARLWDQKWSAKTGYSGFGDLPLCVAYCDESNRLVAGDWTGAFRVFDGKTGKQIGTLDANPPRLADRLAAANQEFAQRKAEHQKVADRLAAVLAEAPKHQAQLEAARKNVAEVAAKFKLANDETAKARSVVDSLNADLQAQMQLVASLPAVLPVLKEAADKSAQAAAKLKGDKDVENAAAQIKSQFAKKQKQLEDAKKAIPERKVRLDKAKVELAAAAKHMSDLRSVLEAAQRQTVDPVATAKAAVAASAQLLAQSEAHVRRWNDEIAFQTKFVEIAALQAKTAQLAEAVQTAQTALDAGKADVAKLQARVDAAQKESDAAAVGVKRAQEYVVQLNAERTAALRQAGAFDALLPALNETLAKAEEASRRVPGDADVTGQVTEIKNLISKKSTELELLKKAAAEKPKAIEAARNQIPLAEKKLAEAKQAIEAAQKKVAEARTSLNRLASKLAAAKAAQNEGTKTVEAAKKELDGLKPHRAA